MTSRLSDTFGWSRTADLPFSRTKKGQNGEYAVAETDMKGPQGPKNLEIDAKKGRQMPKAPEITIYRQKWPGTIHFFGHKTLKKPNFGPDKKVPISGLSATSFIGIIRGPACLQRRSRTH